MLTLGPGTVERGLVPSTALVGCRGMATLGPALGEVAPVDPVARIFLVVGKILALRRAVETEHKGPGAGSAIRDFKALQVAMIDQAVDGHADDWAPWEVVWSPLGKSLADQLPALESIVGRADLAARRVMLNESVRILGLPPSMSHGDRVQAVIDYMGVHGLTVHAQAHGFRDYLMKLFRDAAGVPAAFPASNDPAYPDTWITPEVVVPEGTARPWIMVL